MKLIIHNIAIETREELDEIDAHVGNESKKELTPRNKRQRRKRKMKQKEKKWKKKEHLERLIDDVDDKSVNEMSFDLV